MWSSQRVPGPLLRGLRAHTHTRVCPDVGTARSRLCVEMGGVHRGGRWAVMRWVRNLGQGGRKTGGSSFPQGPTLSPCK